LDRVSLNFLIVSKKEKFGNVLALARISDPLFGRLVFKSFTTPPLYIASPMVIRGVLIASTSGLVLCSTDFSHSDDDDGDNRAPSRSLGSLLTSVMEIARLTTGMGISNIQMQDKTICLVNDHEYQVFCALVQDREDGVLLGRLRCSEFLSTFVQTCATAEPMAATFNSSSSKPSIELRDFHRFHEKIDSVLKDAIKPVLARLQSYRGIKGVTLITESGKLICPSFDDIDDPFHIISSFQTFATMGTDIMSRVGNLVNHIQIDTKEPNSRLLIWRIKEQMFLFVVIDLAVHPSMHEKRIAEALYLIEGLS